MQKGEIIIYTTAKGTDIQLKLDNDTIWLDAHLVAALFDVKRPAVVKHIQNIYKSNELSEESSCSKMEQVAADGKKRQMNLYNLDMIISVGYRIPVWKPAPKKDKFYPPAIYEYWDGYCLSCY